MMNHVTVFGSLNGLTLFYSMMDRLTICSTTMNYLTTGICGSKMNSLAIFGSLNGLSMFYSIMDRLTISGTRMYSLRRQEITDKNDS